MNRSAYAVNSGAALPATNNAAALLRNIITFLAPGANGRGVVLLDNTAYTTNELLTVEVGDSDLAGTGQAQVTFGARDRSRATSRRVSTSPTFNAQEASAS